MRFVQQLLFVLLFENCAGFLSEIDESESRFTYVFKIFLVVSQVFCTIFCIFQELTRDLSARSIFLIKELNLFLSAITNEELFQLFVLSKNFVASSLISTISFWFYKYQLLIQTTYYRLYNHLILFLYPIVLPIRVCYNTLKQNASDIL